MFIDDDAGLLGYLGNGFCSWLVGMIPPVIAGHPLAVMMAVIIPFLSFVLASRVIRKVKRARVAGDTPEEWSAAALVAENPHSGVRTRPLAP